MMALNSIGRASALPIALAIVPSLPRPFLKRLIERAIDHLDELDGDPDLEDADDGRCMAGDDGMFSGAVISLSDRASAFDFEDSEPDEVAAFTLNHRRYAGGRA